MSPDDQTHEPRKKPTLRSIAEETGFSVATVSRALAGDPAIAKGTRRTVRDAAARVNYVPDRAAQRLRTGRTKVVTLLLNTDHEFLGFTNEFLNGLTRALAGTGYAVNITPDPVDHDSRMSTVRNILRNRLADGLILTRTEAFDERIRLMQEARFPFVSHGRTEFTTPHAWVDFDNEHFAREAVQRLVGLGRTRLSMIMPAERFTFSQHLRYGFLSSARRAGIDFEIPDDINLDSSLGDLASYISTRRENAEPPDGYICVGERIALATLSALSDSGVTPGKEADVLAKRASPIFSHIRPRIETVFEDIRETGYHAGKLLLRQFEGAPVDELHVLQRPPASFAMPE